MESLRGLLKLVDVMLVNSEVNPKPMVLMLVKLVQDPSVKGVGVGLSGDVYAGAQSGKADMEMPRY